ncbi:hypothetical protein ABIC74_004197 [Mucilaginibacter rubeus]
MPLTVFINVSPLLPVDELGLVVPYSTVVSPLLPVAMV